MQQVSNWNVGQLQQLESYLDVGIFITDRDLIIRRWNSWLEQHSGHQANTVVGRPLLELYPELKERGLDAFYWQVLDTGNPAVLSHRLHNYLIPMPPALPRPDLPQMAQRARIFPWREGDRIVGTLTIVEDVTDQVLAEADLMRQVQESNALRELVAMVNASLDLNVVLQELVQRAASLVGVSRVSVSLLDQDGDVLRPAAGVFPPFPGANELYAEWLRRELPREMALPLWELMVAGKPQVLPDVLALPELREFAQRYHIRSLLLTPIVREGRPLGMMAFDEPDTLHSFKERQIELANTIANYAAIAIEHARLHQAVSDQAALLEEQVRQRIHELAQERERLQAVLDSAAEGILVVNSDGDVTLANPTAQAWLDRGIGQSDTAAVVLQSIREMVAEGLPNTTRTIETPNLTLEAQATRLQRGDQGYVVVLHDVTRLYELDRLKSQ
ncbi:MAG TPA: PAS domain-containing protein, partial [Anaerolineae bacterium]|nr:PAS domain-containing protein [Anaerolineae bacterium]